MGLLPRVLFDRPLSERPRLSLILLDWSCRESFHIFDYLARQDVPRDWFEVLWIEYYDLVAPDITRRLAEAKTRGETPPVDRWIVMDMPRSAYYHKHLMYNVGVLASRGDIVMIGDSDAMLTPSFVSSILEAFRQTPNLALHLDEIRSHSRKFYPFNYPSFDEVLQNECINWQDGATTGIRETYDPLHVRNYGACFCARRADVIAVGGADEHIDYLGHICGPYDLTWRLVNHGCTEAWHEREFLYHTWHPGSDGDDNYLGPHDGRNVSTLALETRRSGRIRPLEENRVVRHVREHGELPEGSLAEIVALAVGERPLTDWIIDNRKRELSVGRRAWSDHRYADALAVWEPLAKTLEHDARFLADLGWIYYHLGRSGDARSAFGKSLRLVPDDPYSLRGLGWTCSVEGDHAVAVEQLTRAIGLADPLDRVPLQEAYRGRAWANFHLGETPAAIADFETARSLSQPTDGSLQDIERGLGWARLRLGHHGPAADHFLRALTLLGSARGPVRTDALNGVRKASEARMVGAETPSPEPPRVVEAEPQSKGTVPPDEWRARLRASLQLHLGESLAAAGRHEEASRLFRRALSGDPANSRAACAAGWSAFQMNQLDSADRAFKRALRHPEMDATLRLEALRGRAWIAYRQGRVHDSMKIFRRASRLARRHGSADVKQDVERGFLRASYLAGTGDTTLAALAEACQTSKLETAIRMSAASLRSRLRGSGPRAGRA